MDLKKKCLSNVLISGESNFDKRNAQQIRGSFLKRNNFLQNPYFNQLPDYEKSWFKIQWLPLYFALQNIVDLAGNLTA